jgi:hypothetical protein
MNDFGMIGRGNYARNPHRALPLPFLLPADYSGEAISSRSGIAKSRSEMAGVEFDQNAFTAAEKSDDCTRGKRIVGARSNIGNSAATA